MNPVHHQSLPTAPPKKPVCPYLQCQAHQAAKHLQGASLPTIYLKAGSRRRLRSPAVPLVSRTRALDRLERPHAAATVAVRPRRENPGSRRHTGATTDLKVIVTGGN